MSPADNASTPVRRKAVRGGRLLKGDGTTIAALMGFSRFVSGFCLKQGG